MIMTQENRKTNLQCQLVHHESPMDRFWIEIVPPRCQAEHGRTHSKVDRFTYIERIEMCKFLCSKLSEEHEKIVVRPHLYT